MTLIEKYSEFNGLIPTAYYEDVEDILDNHFVRKTDTIIFKDLFIEKQKVKDAIKEVEKIADDFKNPEYKNAPNVYLFQEAIDAIKIRLGLDK